MRCALEFPVRTSSKNKSSRTRTDNIVTVLTKHSRPSDPDTSHQSQPSIRAPQLSVHAPDYLGICSVNHSLPLCVASCAAPKTNIILLYSLHSRPHVRDRIFTIFFLAIFIPIGLGLAVACPSNYMRAGRAGPTDAG